MRRAASVDAVTHSAQRRHDPVKGRDVACPHGRPRPRAPLPVRGVRRTGARSLCELRRRAGSNRAARVRALRLSGRLAGAAVRRMLGPPAGVRAGARGNRVRRAREEARLRVEGARAPRPRGRTRCARGRRRRTTFGRPAHIRAGRQGARAPARACPRRAARCRTRRAVGHPRHRRARPSRVVEAAGDVAASGSPGERARRVLDVSAGTSAHRSRGRRLHHRRDAVRLRDRAAEGRRAPRGGRLPGEGGALALDDHDQEAPCD